MDREEQELHDQKVVSRLSFFHVSIIFLITAAVAIFFTQSLSFTTELTDSILNFLIGHYHLYLIKGRTQPADFQHMFGHYKINSIAALFQSLLIIGLFADIFYESLVTLLFHLSTYQTINGLIGAASIGVISVIVFINSTIMLKLGQRSNNSLILAQGMHFRSDLYMNISLVIGLFIASSGVYIVDLILALVFSGYSILVGLKILQRTFNELTDANTISQDIVDQIEDKIRSFDGIQKLDKLLLKTAGNKLDARVYIKVDRENSIFSTQEITSSILKTIDNSFPNFICNTMIQLDADTEADPQNTDYVFELIQDIASKEKNLSNIHNIALDIYQDQIHIQCHIDLRFDTKLKEAHALATAFEQKIIDRIRELKPDQKVEVITHIEPAGLIKKKHSHAMTRPIPGNLYENVHQILEQESDIHEIKDIRVFQEAHENYVTIKIALNPESTIEETHAISEKIEDDLYNGVPFLRRCIIHTEPDLY